MKRLLLIRHGHAVPGSAERGDFERILSPSGEREVATVADRLAKSRWLPQSIVTSSAPRAQATATILARRLALPRPQVEGSLYLAGRDALLQSVARHGGDSTILAIVAHNPGLTQLVRELANVRLDDLPTAGIAGIAFDSDAWNGLADGVLEYFDAPLLRGGR